MSNISSPGRIRNHGATASFSGLVCVVICLVGCSQPEFQCGVPSAADPSQATRCSEAGAICICPTLRCAVPCAACSESGYRYEHTKDDECVSAADIASFVTSGTSGFCTLAAANPPRCGVTLADGSNATCKHGFKCLCGARNDLGWGASETDGGGLCVQPEKLGDTYIDAAGEPVRSRPRAVVFADDGGKCPSAADLDDCGVPGGRTCPEDHYCVCDTHRCAFHDPAVCIADGTKSAFRYEQALAVAAAECVQVDEVPSMIDVGLCTQADPFPCGAADDPCPGPNDVCICAKGHCARPIETPEGETNTCPSGLRYTVSDVCVPALEASTRVPGSPEGAGCQQPDTCGDGLSPCKYGVCICDGGGQRYCAREVADTTCKSGLQATDGACVALGGGTYKVPGKGRCDQYACGGLGEVTPCDAGQECICRPSGGLCAYEDPECASDFRYWHDERCVAYDDESPTVRVAADKVCPPSPERVGCTLDETPVCANDGQCVCDGTKAWCTVEQQSCEGTHLAYEGTGVCVEAPPTTVETDGKCPDPLLCGAGSSACLSDESCICPVGRCAESDEDCPSGLRLKGEDPACVVFSNLTETQVLPPAGVCAAAGTIEDVACGAGGQLCEAEEACLCAGGEAWCAQEEGSCASEWRFTKTGLCAPVGATEIAAIQSCPTTEACGADGQICPADQSCACVAGLGQCALAIDPGTCPSGWAFANGGCLTFTNASTTEVQEATEACTPVSDLVDQACGPGLPSCPEDQECTCDGAAGWCTLPEKSCSSQRRFAGSGTCFVVGGKKAGTNNACPPGSACGGTAAGATLQCGAEESCVCKNGAGMCATKGSTVCASGLQYTDGGCVVYTTSDVTEVVGPAAECQATLKEVACGLGELACAGKCLCETAEASGVCGVAEASCASGQRSSGTGKCVAAAAFEIGDGQTCAAKTGCGTLSGGALLSCPGETDVCVCSSDGGQCTYPDAACASTGLRFKGTGACLSYEGSPGSQWQVGPAELCPSAAPVGCPAGKCASGTSCLCSMSKGLVCVDDNPACASGKYTAAEGICVATSDLCTPKACGVVSDNALQACATGQSCLCSAAGGSCAVDVAETICASGFLSSGETPPLCVAWPAAGWITVLADAEKLCPSSQPDDLPCDDVCPCACSSKLCVVQQLSCPSGWVRAGSGTCTDAGDGPIQAKGQEDCK